MGAGDLGNRRVCRWPRCEAFKLYGVMLCRSQNSVSRCICQHAPEEVKADAGGAGVHQDEHGDVLGELGAHAANGEHGEAAVHEEHQVPCSIAQSRQPQVKELQEGCDALWRMELHEGSAGYSRLLGHHRQARCGGAPELSVKAALMSTAPAAGSNSEGQ